jgi:catechol 2,3-dioxygenase-like lactoylglutathione lyase family enzyme
MEQGDYKLAQLGIVMLGVRDMARALGFYRDKLGLKLQSEIAGIAFLDAGAVTLCLSEPALKARSQLAGAGEIAFRVEDINAAYHALEAKGIRFTHEPRSLTPKSWIANFDDPDGNHLSIFGPQSQE